MSTGTQLLADAAEDDFIRLDQEFARRALGARPWTVADYYVRVERLNAQYAICRESARRSAAVTS